MKASIVCTILLLVAMAHLYGLGIRYNGSESLPQTLFLAIPTKEVHRGDIIAFQLPEKSPATFAKIAIGLPGDMLTIKDNKIYINDEEKGEFMVTLKPIEGGIIPEGYFFVMGHHLRSFDSRYAEFGLVPQTNIKETLCPIF